MTQKLPTSSRRMIKSLLTTLLIVVAAGSWQLCSGGNNASPRIDTPADSLLMVKTPAGTSEQIIEYTGFTVSFNATAHIPNWVAWELTRDEVNGTVARSNKFITDTEAEGCPETYDYSYSGYDRGHMCPAGDMKWSTEAMHDSFYLTNICPQAKSLNTGAWKNLEEKCRQWARADSSIIIVCGPILTDTLREAIGDTRVSVPERFFKVILSPHSTPVRGIGFIMNNGRVKGGIQQTAVSIDAVEAATGIDFFSALPDSIENIVEAQCDFPYWSTIR